MAEFDIVYGHGISREGELLDLGVQQSIVDKSGAWFSYGDLRLGQGRENSKAFLRDNIETAADIERRLREAFGIIAPAPTAEEVAADEMAAAQKA